MNNTVIISNDKLKVTISKIGAEIISIIDLHTNKEILWQGDEAIWDGQAPLLFPVIGRLKDRKYTINGNSYSIDIHGFAQSSLFTIKIQNDTNVSLTLTHSDETLKLYPFAFELEISYTLEDRTIHKKHIVKNNSDETMYYEIGGHEGFRLDLFGNDKMSDYELRFPEQEILKTFTSDETTMMNKETVEVPIQNGTLKLSMDLFANDALVFENIKNSICELWHVENGKILEVNFADFPYLGIWTKYIPNICRYICIEPWSSLPDANFLGYELNKKIGVRSLANKEIDTLTYKMLF